MAYGAPCGGSERYARSASPCAVPRTALAHRPVRACVATLVNGYCLLAGNEPIKLDRGSLYNPGPAPPVGSSVPGKCQVRLQTRNRRLQVLLIFVTLCSKSHKNAHVRATTEEVMTNRRGFGLYQ
eukprot:1208995-Prymnesium_polylepis.1